MANTIRTTQTELRSISDGPPGARVTQVTLRPVSDGIPGARVTQVELRVLSDYGPAGGSRRRPTITIHT